MRKVLHIKMFKSFCMEYEGVSITYENIKSEKVIKLLSYLLFYENRSLPSSELIDLIWADEEIDNPTNALKNLIYRLRTILKKEIGIDDFIVTGKNAYAINNEYELDIDAQHFEEACKKLNSDPTNYELYETILTIYTGSFMNEIKEDHRSLSRSAYFHSRYISMMIEYAKLLEKNQSYNKMEEMARKVINLDRMDEDIHLVLIKALYFQGNYQKALNTYKETTKFLYQTLGTEPSEEMKELYEMMKRILHDEGLDIQDIQSELSSSEQFGAFLCEYGTFRDLYNMQARMMGRLGICAHLCLLTVKDTSRFEYDLENNKKIVEKTMQKIQEAMVSGLRVGDAVSRFSNNQFLALLAVCSFEDAQMAMERVLKKIRRSLNNKNIHIDITIQEVNRKLEVAL